ncbi:ROK family protein [Galbitalea soli]|uniref:ROK family protein n=1 Tax=Galbitalea soli TaxID=1268042 RepID=A0A7C9TRD9_9MICO|nr:ROK family protein [Galbitalea soli]NEM91420.1 ROK family protein [Galbitalea soli]NYJ30113.1 putative NBD/HSP70 family sugar kinase [Galbitalea soli]
MTAPAAPLVAAEDAPVLALLRDGVPHTRAQLIELSGLSRSTLGLRLDSLLASGLVGPAGGGVSSGGRPPAYLAFRADARVIGAIDLGATHGVVALTDLAGRILSLESRELDIAEGPLPILDWATDALARLLAAARRPARDLAGIGVGVPGPVEHSTGIPTNPPIMPGWDGFDVPARLRERYRVPVLVDNDVNLLALGEHATVHPGVDDLFFVKVATGIGAGIISGGRLQRGAQGTAGDLGHVRVPFSSRTPAHGAADADLEALASGPALAGALAAAGIPATSTSDVAALARAGDPAAIDAVRQAGRDLGEVVATCVNVLNPSVVVIGGGLVLAGEHLVAGVREVVYGQSTPLATRYLTITESRSGETGGVTGAAIMLVQHLLEPR